MAQRDLVTAWRAHRRAKENVVQTRADLDEEIRAGVKSEEWLIEDVVALTGWSRETVRKIVNEEDAPGGE